MRSLVAVAALAATLGACQPDSDKTNPAVATDESTTEKMAGADWDETQIAADREAARNYRPTTRM